jgi:hypothetical protein
LLFGGKGRGGLGWCGVGRVGIERGDGAGDQERSAGVCYDKVVPGIGVGGQGKYFNVFRWVHTL